MKEPTRKIVFISDDQSFIKLIEEYLRPFGWNVQSILPKGISTKLESSNNEFDAIVLDADFSSSLDSIDLLKDLKKYGFSSNIFYISYRNDPQFIADLIKDYVDDYIVKPVDLDRLRQGLDRLCIGNISEMENIDPSLSNMDLKDEPTAFSPSEHISPSTVRLDHNSAPILGNSDVIKKLNEYVTVIAPTDVPILIVGEQGTEKDQIAARLHQLSHFSASNFVHIECVGLNAEALEARLLGSNFHDLYSVNEPVRGELRQAHKGTLFFSNIHELDLKSQAVLFRILKNYVLHITSQAFSTTKIHCRLIASANQSIFNLKSAEKFRSDVFNMVSSIQLEIPSLNDRRADIKVLAEQILDQFINRNPQYRGRSFSPDALKRLQNADWSENLDQLRNTIQKVCISLEHPLIMEADIKLFSKQAVENNMIENLFEQTSDFQQFKDASERLFLKYYLDKYAWNITQTAESIGIQRSHLYNKIKKYKLKRI